jgi:hypothetical protein
MLKGTVAPDSIGLKSNKVEWQICDYKYFIRTADGKHYFKTQIPPFQNLNSLSAIAEHR